MLQTFQSGALLDERPELEKERDFTFGEIVSAPDPVKWVEKKESEWRKFPITSQNGSGSCVAQTRAKQVGVLHYLKDGVYIPFSATDVYQRRSNRPRGGMAGVEAFTITKDGITLEQLAPSQDMTDKEMDSFMIEKYKRDVGDVFKTGEPIILPTGDIDLIASVIQKTGKAVMIWFYFERKEWTRDVPVITNKNLIRGKSTTLRHSVVAIDFFLYKGKKALLIEDSWGIDNGMKGRRIITEEFFKTRNWFAAYDMNFKFDENALEVKSKYFFQSDLLFGMQNDSVKALQEVLQGLGFFPKNASTTGLYGSITATSVLKFQRAYRVASDLELNSLAGKRVGSKTREVLNNL